MLASVLGDPGSSGPCGYKHAYGEQELMQAHIYSHKLQLHIKGFKKPTGPKASSLRSTFHRVGGGMQAAKGGRQSCLTHL